jgi:hypothetical protein
MYSLDETSKLWEQIIARVFLESYEKETKEKERDVQRRAKNGKNKKS